MTALKKLTITVEDLNRIHNEAHAATLAMGFTQDAGCCGFGWVVVRGLRGNIRNVLKAAGFKQWESERGLVLWCSLYNQSLDMKERYAHEYAKRLREFGFDAIEKSRMD